MECHFVSVEAIYLLFLGNTKQVFHFLREVRLQKQYSIKISQKYQIVQNIN